MLLVSSFFNEEYLLPWWCEHHKQMFDRAILFDYYSTDRSCEIIKKICPNWEIRKTRNKDWNFADNDLEYMKAEREYTGYKIVLTTTEFLLGNIEKLPHEKTAFRIPMIRMIDIDPENKPTYDRSLILQKSTGIPDKSANRFRFLHNYKDGLYTTGRHKIGYPSKDLKGVYIYKYVFCPWTDEFIQRKLNMKKYISPSDREKGLGRHHYWDKKELLNKYDKELKKYEIEYSNTRK